MNYKIKSIELDKEAAEKLIEDIAAKIANGNFDAMERMPVEYYFQSEDKKIDIWCKVQFHSEFQLTNDEIDGLGRTCINRTVRVDILFTESETGEEIEVKCSVELEEEIEKKFYI